MPVSMADERRQTCHHLRLLSQDPLLHQLRLRISYDRVDRLLRQRPPLHTLQPPTSSIYLTRTHLAARRLHWSLVCIRLNRSLSRRPKLSTLISANILPKECCRLDRRSGDFLWGFGVAGGLVERKRQVERERLKEGLRVWLERKAREIPFRRKEGGVGVLVWRFSKTSRPGGTNGPGEPSHGQEKPKKDKVNGLKSFWENLGGRSA